GGDNQDLRDRDVGACDQRRNPDPRRQRLHYRARGRALLAGRAANDDLRRHVRDPAQDHLGPADRAAPVSEPGAGPITGRSNYFEDFKVGDRFRHSRGTTVSELENQLLTKLVMNTAQAHFNEHAMKDTPWGQRLVFGLVTGAIVMGLSTQDDAENAVAELRLDKLRSATPPDELGANVITGQAGRGEMSRVSGPCTDDDSEHAFGGYYASLNRNKRSLVLDLKSTGGKEAIMRLAEKSEVLVENFAAGV